MSNDPRQSTETEAVYQALLQLVADVAGYRTREDLFRSLSTRLRELAPFDQLGVVLHNPDTGLLELALEEPAGGVQTVVDLPFPLNRIPLDFGPSGWVWQSQQPAEYSLTDVQAQPTLEHLRRAGYRAVCFVPLTTPRMRLGTLGFASRVIERYPAASIALMGRIAQLLALALEHTMQVEQAEQYRREATAQRDRLRILLDVNNALVTVHSGPFELSVLETVRAAVPHDYASLAIFDPDARALRLEAITLYDDRGLTAPRTLLPIDASPSGLAFSERKPLIFRDLAQFPAPGVVTLRHAGMQWVCCVPLFTRHGTLGTLNIARRTPDVCPPEHVDLLVDVAGQVAIALENALAFREISDLKDRLNEEKLYLEGEISRQSDFSEIIGSSSALSHVLEQIRTVAPTDANVLLLGETGTGKELPARAIHQLSRRRDRTFVRVNGAALPAGLVESELFGYEKGAFTGAIATKVGRLELADGGTLFLDEVGDLPLDVQPKLLRALQEREVERLGSTRVRRVDVRLVAATNRDLEEMVAAGTFRSDLFYRLNVFPVRVPPLRERPEDIPMLVQHFARRFARDMGRPPLTIPRAVADALMLERWPGNIRELQNVVERAVILSRGTTLQLPASALSSSGPRRPAAPAASRPSQGLRDHERDVILRALRDANGVIGGPAGAAVRLGVKRTTLHSMMRKLGIQKPTY